MKNELSKPIPISNLTLYLLITALFVSNLYLLSALFKEWLTVANMAYSGTTVIIPKPIPDKLTHAQRVYLGALEWCESRARADVVNENDPTGNDYYWFQFQANTFYRYLYKYKLNDIWGEPSTLGQMMKNYEITMAIIENMILDKEIKWSNEFPSCVAKLGMPPRY